MEKRLQKRIFLAQNFLRTPRLVRELIDLSSICTSDVIYEIGPGKGIITAELAKRAKKVVAIEKDARLAVRLRERFREHDNVEIIEKDFLAYSITDRNYKIFASIPFNLTAQIVRKILYMRPAPSDSYLIMQREPARKFAGLPRETLFSVLAKPYVEFEIVRRLKKTDFDPAPSVDSLLLRIKRRGKPLIPAEDAAAFRRFVEIGFCSWKKNLKSTYKHDFSYKQWKRAAREWRFPLKATPTDLTFDQWLGLFERWPKPRWQIE